MLKCTEGGLGSSAECAMNFLRWQNGLGTENIIMTGSIMRGLATVAGSVLSLRRSPWLAARRDGVNEGLAAHTVGEGRGSIPSVFLTVIAAA